MSTTLPLFPKIPHYRRSADLLHAVRRVVCLEKLDGTNTRIRIPRGATGEGDLVVGSRTRTLAADDRRPPALREVFLSEPGRLSRCLALSEELSADVVLFGETVGRGICANGFIYGHRPQFVLFAAMLDGAWLSFDSRLTLTGEGSSFEERLSLCELAQTIGLTLAPCLYSGPPDGELFDNLIARPSTFAKQTGRSDAPQEGIVIWSDPLLLDSAHAPLVAKLKDPRRVEALDREDEGLEAPQRFAERVVQLERLRHARQHLQETRRQSTIWGEQVRLLKQRVVQDVSREVPEYQAQIAAHGKAEIRSALHARVEALLPALDACDSGDR